MNFKRSYMYITIFIGILFCFSAYAFGDKSGEEINWQVISNGGTEGNSSNYILKGTISQTAVSSGNSDNYGLDHGFWQDFGGTSGPCQGECGDANHDLSVNVSDAVYIINFAFSGGNQPIPVLACGDSNSDGSVNVSDAVHIINFAFSGGAQPGDCMPGSPNWTDGDCCPFTP